MILEQNVDSMKDMNCTNRHLIWNNSKKIIISLFVNVQQLCFYTQKFELSSGRFGILKINNVTDYIGLPSLKRYLCQSPISKLVRGLPKVGFLLAW